MLQQAEAKGSAFPSKVRQRVRWVRADMAASGLGMLPSYAAKLLPIKRDDGQPAANVASQTFAVTVAPVNDAPVFSLSGDVLESQDFAGVRVVAVTPQPVPADESAQSVSYSLSPDFALTLRGRNLLDEEYFNSADRKSPVAPGRSVSLSLSWSGS